MTRRLSKRMLRWSPMLKVRSLKKMPMTEKKVRKRWNLQMSETDSLLIFRCSLQNNKSKPLIKT